MTEHSEREVDEALAAVRRVSDSGEVPVVVVKHPWWVTLRLPLLILAVAFLLNSLSMVLLVVRDTSRAANDAERREVARCDAAYTARVTEAAAASRLATSGLVVHIGEGLRLLTVDGTLEAFDLAGYQAAIGASEQANKADAEAVLAREAWRNAGQPLPCPITPLGDPVHAPAADPDS